jgi:hypothetical protein
MLQTSTLPPQNVDATATAADANTSTNTTTPGGMPITATVKAARIKSNSLVGFSLVGHNCLVNQNGLVDQNDLVDQNGLIDRNNLFDHIILDLFSHISLVGASTTMALLAS